VSNSFIFLGSSFVFVKYTRMIDGAILVDKPQGWTSHDVVAKIRNFFRLEKVGHCGTLDPMATGLLVIVVGKGTKLSNSLMCGDKRYSGEMTLGVTTDSYDAEGEILETRTVGDINETQVKEIFLSMKGDQYQLPPMVSAKKIGGKPLYKLARKGITVEREPRLIHIYDFNFLTFELPRIGFDLKATKGTYVRTITHDIGEKLGCGAHLSMLRRTESGDFKVQDAIALDDLLKLSIQDFEKRVIPVYRIKV